ncbi:MAG: anti-sigma factor [Sphingomicrobium sp.]
MSPDDRDQLAAEFALGALSGPELAQARALAASDPRFRAEIARWSGRLSPLLEEVASVEPPAALWSGIERSLTGPAASGANVIQLRRRVGLWRGIAGGAMALAASLALVLVTRPPPAAPPAIAPVTVEAPAPMVAMLDDDAHDMKLVASWNPAQRRLMVAAASDIRPGPDHAHELWMIPADGKPRSLGTMPGPKMRATLDLPMASQLREGVTLALSVEPIGGSPTGLPTGPVVASGKLERA